MSPRKSSVRPARLLRAQIDDAVGRLHHGGLVFHYQNGVAHVAQALQDFNQPLVVARDGDRSRVHPAHTKFRPTMSPMMLRAGCVALPRRTSVEASRSRLKYSRPTLCRKREAGTNFLKSVPLPTVRKAEIFSSRKNIPGILHCHRSNFGNRQTADPALSAPPGKEQAQTLRTPCIAAIAAQEDTNV